jgi:hypothetical protein
MFKKQHVFDEVSTKCREKQILSDEKGNKNWFRAKREYGAVSLEFIGIVPASIARKK